MFKDKFPVIYSKFISSKECNICFRTIDDTCLSFLECGHYYCTDCLNINSKLSRTCPECRTSYTHYYKLNYSNKIRYLQNLVYNTILIVSESNHILKLLTSILYRSTILKSGITKTNKKYYLTNYNNYTTLDKYSFDKIIFLDDINIIEHSSKITRLENNII